MKIRFEISFCCGNITQMVLLTMLQVKGMRLTDEAIMGFGNPKLGKKTVELNSESVAECQFGNERSL